MLCNNAQNGLNAVYFQLYPTVGVLFLGDVAVSNYIYVVLILFPWKNLQSIVF